MNGGSPYATAKGRDIGSNNSCCGSGRGEVLPVVLEHDERLDLLDDRLRKLEEHVVRVLTDMEDLARG